MFATYCNCIKIAEKEKKGNSLKNKQTVLSNPASYFKHYRQSLGFANQNDAKSFLAGKDILPNVDFIYIDALNKRIVEVICRINKKINKSCRIEDIDTFSHCHLFRPYKIIKEAQLLPKLNNQGRRPEEVLFSWLRGFVVCEYFMPAFSAIFSISQDLISHIGDDDLKNIETFKRSPKADLQIIVNKTPVRIEVQSGFQGINDIKEHKVREARRVFCEEKMRTVCIHIDLYNGQVAFVQLDQIADNDVNFVTRQQMEGQSVFSIDQNFFKWRLLDAPPTLQGLELSL